MNNTSGIKLYWMQLNLLHVISFREGCHVCAEKSVAVLQKIHNACAYTDILTHI